MIDQGRERLSRLEYERPRIHAGRHVAKGAGQVLLAVLGVSLFLKLVPLPDLSISLPDVDLPIPDLSLPDVSLPAWLAVLLKTAKFWAPLLIGAAVALAELSKRRRKS